MTAYHVSTVNLLGNEQIDSYHNAMFHGATLKENGQLEVILQSRRTMQSWPGVPLRLLLNGYRWSLVFKPHGNLVLTKELADRINTIPNVSCYETKLIKVCSLPYAEGDFGFWDEPQYHRYSSDPRVLMLSAPGNLDLMLTAPEFYELIPCNPYELGSRYAVRDSPGISGLLEIDRNMVEEYPVSYLAGGVILREDVFQKIDRSLNKSYFNVNNVHLI